MDEKTTPATPATGEDVRDDKNGPELPEKSWQFFNIMKSYLPVATAVAVASAFLITLSSAMTWSRLTTGNWGMTDFLLRKLNIQVSIVIAVASIAGIFLPFFMGATAGIMYQKKEKPKFAIIFLVILAIAVISVLSALCLQENWPVSVGLFWCGYLVIDLVILCLFSQYCKRVIERRFKVALKVVWTHLLHAALPFAVLFIGSLYGLLIFLTYASDSTLKHENSFVVSVLIVASGTLITAALLITGFYESVTNFSSTLRSVVIIIILSLMSLLFLGVIQRVVIYMDNGEAKMNTYLYKALKIGKQSKTTILHYFFINGHYDFGYMAGSKYHYGQIYKLNTKASVATNLKKNELIKPDYHCIVGPEKRIVCSEKWEISLAKKRTAVRRETGKE